MFDLVPGRKYVCRNGEVVEAYRPSTTTTTTLAKVKAGPRGYGYCERSFRYRNTTYASVFAGTEDEWDLMRPYAEEWEEV